MSAALQLSELRCHAKHPDLRKQRAGVVCNGPVARVPGDYEFVTTAYRMPDLSDGHAWMVCKRCGMWNGFRVMASGRRST